MPTLQIMLKTKKRPANAQKLVLLKFNRRGIRQGSRRLPGT
jgi:hypothetical protein